MKAPNKKQLSTYIILGSVVFLVIAVLAVSMLLKNDSESSPIVTTKIRASSLTYRRTITIGGAQPTAVPGSSGTPAATTSTPSPTVTRGAGSQITPGASQTTPGNGTPASSSTETPTPTETETLTPTMDPLADTVTPSDSVTETPEASSTPVTSLPNTGTVQYTSILFIAASVVLFISFLF